MGGARWVEQQVRLFPCQNCLAKLHYRCFEYNSQTSMKQKIVEEFNAKEAFDFLFSILTFFVRLWWGSVSHIAVRLCPRLVSYISGNPCISQFHLR